MPDKIASDGRSTSNDRRIHPGLSCIRCHDDGIKPFDDWARAFYREPTELRDGARLQASDYEKFKRLKRLYLSDLDGELKRDQQDYARALFAVNKLKPAANAALYAETYADYAETSVDGEQFARELGVTLPRLKDALGKSVKATGSLDVVLLGYLRRPEWKARREMVEEVFATAQILLRAYP